MQISITHELVEKIKLAAIHFIDLSVKEKCHEIDLEFDCLNKELLNKYPSIPEASAALIPARKLYHSIGMDPTKKRPSSEALLRRVILQKPMYKINSVVDISNLCSLRFLLPIGLYDSDKINGNIIFRLGVQGEGYEGINKGRINVENRLTIADDIAPFGNPSSDSSRTMITLQSKNVLFVIYAPYNYLIQKLEKHSKWAQEKMIQYNGGSAELIQTLP